MSARSDRKRDRARRCFRDEAAPVSRPARVTSGERETARRIAEQDPEAFAGFVLKTPQFVSLYQLPWWPQFRQDWPEQAALIEARASAAGVSVSR